MWQEIKRYKIGVIAAIIQMIAFTLLLLLPYTVAGGAVLMAICLICACVTIWDVGRRME